MNQIIIFNKYIDFLVYILPFFNMTFGKNDDKLYRIDIYIYVFANMRLVSLRNSCKMQFHREKLAMTDVFKAMLTELVMVKICGLLVH